MTVKKHVYTLPIIIGIDVGLLLISSIRTYKCAKDSFAE